MKSSNTVVTIVVVAAVLVAAYALGLLIHQARVGDSSSSATSPAEVNEARLRESTANLSHEPGAGRIQDTQEARAQLKEQRAQTLEKMETATEEEKAEVREQVRDRLSPQSSRKMPRRLATRRTGTADGPVTPDPNASQSEKKTESEPNGAGES